jgi:hypothetical protein
MSHDDDRDPEATSPIPERRPANQNADGSYTIPHERLSVLQAGVDKLNKRAAKLGMEPVSVVSGQPFAQQYIEVEPAEYGDDGRILPRSERIRTRWLCNVHIKGSVPVVAGFSFIAKLDHLEGGNLVLRAPGWDGDLDGWRVVGSRCQHCGLARSRAATFLIRDESGNIIQVGRQCLQDYTRNADVENAVKLFKCWQELLAGGSDDSDGEGSWGFGGYCAGPTPTEYLAAAVSSIRHRGFHKSGAEERSTRSFCDFITGPCPKDKGERGDREEIALWKSLQPTDAQRAQAAEVLAWVLASNDSSDYMHNARLACAERTVRSRTEGILASLPSMHNKAMGREQERRERPVAGPYVGVTKGKVTLKVTVKYVTGWESEQYRTSGVFMILADENNSTIMVRATGAIDRQANADDFKDGQWYIHGTVKKHEPNAKRNGEPVTWLTRCVMRRDPFPPEKPKRPRKPKPASKGAPMYGYKETDIPNVCGSVCELAYEWICPPGVAFSWDAHREGTRLHELSSKAWLSRVKPAAPAAPMSQVAEGFQF